jgi:hypothetical protein
MENLIVIGVVVFGYSFLTQLKKQNKRDGKSTINNIFKQ